MVFATYRKSSLFLAFLLICCLHVAAGQQHPANPAPQASAALPGATPGQYADTDICKTCHQEIWEKHFAGTPHAALLQRRRTWVSVLSWARAGARGWWRGRYEIVRFETLSPAQTAKSARDAIRLAWKRRTSPSPSTWPAALPARTVTTHTIRRCEFHAREVADRALLWMPCRAEGPVCPAVPPSRGCRTDSMQRLSQSSRDRARRPGPRRRRPVRSLHQVPYRHYGAVCLRACSGQD